MIYQSDITFKVWAYTVSHSILILRGSNNSEDINLNYNVEVEFYGVRYIELPVLMRGISIQELHSTLPKKIEHYRNESGYKIFKLEAEAINYVVASSCIIGRHNWSDDIDRISNPTIEFDQTLFHF